MNACRIGTSEAGSQVMGVSDAVENKYQRSLNTRQVRNEIPLAQVASDDAGSITATTP